MLESYSGSSIVRWYGNIEKQILDFISKYEQGRNQVYVTKLQNFLQTWRQFPLDGGINRETLDPLQVACSTLGVDPWQCANYFISLRDSIKELIASEEELPRGEYSAPKGGGGGGGLASQAPPGMNDFGGQEDPGAQEQPPGTEPPPEEGGPPGAGGPPPPGQPPQQPSFGA